MALSQKVGMLHFGRRIG